MNIDIARERLLRDLFSGFIRIHILFHCGQRPFFGGELREELEEHGYSVSWGTLYPLLHSLCAAGCLARQDRIVGGRVRKYYTLTPDGEETLKAAREKVRELAGEVMEGLATPGRPGRTTRRQPWKRRPGN